MSAGNRLLIIDDEPAIGRFVKRTAEAVGFEVTVTDDPSVFVKAARLWHPTVVMLDLNMPNTDGIQLLRTLAGDKCTGHVVVSSGADARVLEAAVRLGSERGLKMGGMLQKPIRVDALKAMLAGFAQIPKEVLRSDLVKAIAADELFLEYQPKLDLEKGHFVGVEALVRWRHPMQGIIRPDEFVALAEESDLIHSLTDWVVRTAATQTAQWRREGLSVEVAVNITARDVEDIDLPERLASRCRDAGLDPTDMIVELTETGAMREAVQMMDVLTRLRLKGFRLSIDDFGTGYSSLVQLMRMPFSELKVDQSFVRHMTNDHGCRTIVEIVLDLAQKLGLHSVAEGVEDRETLNALMRRGCDVAQGYFMSRPVGADRISQLFREFTLPRIAVEASEQL